MGMYYNDLFYEAMKDSEVLQEIIAQLRDMSEKIEKHRKLLDMFVKENRELGFEDQLSSHTIKGLKEKLLMEIIYKHEKFKDHPYNPLRVPANPDGSV